MSQELKNRTKKFALDVIGLCAGLPHLPETRHAIDQLIRSSSSVAANYRSACRGKSKADFIAKLGIVEEEADESGFWLEMLRDVCELLSANSELRTHHPLNRSRTEIRDSKLDLRTSQELGVCSTRPTSLLQSQWHRGKQHAQRDDHSELRLRLENINSTFATQRSAFVRITSRANAASARTT